MLLHELPVDRDSVGIGLGAVHDALRELLVVTLVAALLVVVAAYLDEIEGAWRVLVPRHLLRHAVPVVVHSQRRRARGVLLLDSAGDGLSNLLTTHVGTLGNLVADAPHNDAGVVAVAAHHESSVVLKVRYAYAHGLAVDDGLLLTREVVAVVILAFLLLPLVETFVDNQHTQRVAGVEEGFGGQVMARAHGIVALCLHQFYLAYLGTVDGGTAQKSVVVVDAAAAKFHRLAVEQETLVGRERDSADAEGDFQGIANATSSVEQADASFVAVRIVY